MSPLAWAARTTLVLLIAAVMFAVPADAKKKRKRASYNPPQAALVVDAYTGKVLYAENADKARFPASVTKVMTLYILFEQIRDGRMTPNTELKVSEEAASRPPSKLGLKPGSTITARDAMYALVTKSANDVAAVVAENISGSEAAFGRLMTQKARSIGMNDTTFRNASGLPDPSQTTTAHDLATLGRRMLVDFPDESKIFRTRIFQYGKAKYKNHNGLLYSYEGTDGMKTGYTRASGFNLLTSCRRDDKHLIAVVLGGRSSAHRNARMRTLLNQSWRKAAAFNDIKQRKVKPVAFAAAGAVVLDEMPERNPAFHASVAERTLSIAVAAAREAIEERPEAIEEPSPPARLALAGLSSGPTLASSEANVEEEAEDEGDASAEVQPAEAVASANTFGPYHVQVGSFLDADSAKGRLTQVSIKASKLVGGHRELTVLGDVRGKAYYRARFGQFSQEEASKTCARLKRLSIDCLVVRAE